MTFQYVDADGVLLLAAMGIPEVAPFTPSQIGMSPRTACDLVTRGHLRRIFRGVYAASTARDTLAFRAQALGLVLPPEAVVADRTAAWLYGVDTLLPGEHLVVPPVRAFHRARGGRLRREGVGSGQRFMADRDVQEWCGLSVTTPLRTACDLGMNRMRDHAFAGMEAMVRAGVDRDEICGELPRFRGHRWVRDFRAFAPLMDPFPDSIAESITRLRWYDATGPFPQTQRPVTGPNGEQYSLDLGVDELYFAVEYDGEEFHASAEAAAHDAERRSWIEAHTPWMIRVVRKDNIFGRNQDFDRLLKGWLREARSTLGQRLRHGRWYDDIGD